MKALSLAPILVCVVLVSWAQSAVAQECSTEKVNDDCTVTMDRSYPVGLPTIQVRPGKRLTVKVLNGLPFEILSLDLQTGQAVVGTDQTAGFLSAALPNLKGLLVQQQTSGVGMFGFRPPSPNAELPPRTPEEIQKKIKDLQAQVYEAQQQLNTNFRLVQLYDENATTIYNQLNEVLGPLPPEVLPKGQRLQSSKVRRDVPRPWIGSEFPDWVGWMRCEIAGQDCPTELDHSSEAATCVGTRPPVRGLLLCGSTLVSGLSACPADQQDDNLLACKLVTIQQDASDLPEDAKKDFSESVRRLNEGFAALTADSTAIANIDKELSVYYFNLTNALVIPPSASIGTIFDPHDSNNQRNVQLPRFLGRQVVYSVSGLNEIGTPAPAVTTAAQKKSILTITVVFADPHFEVSSGIVISTLPNRSFANQTTVTQNPNGASPTLGNVVITQTISKPTVVLFAGANWRLGHDFLWPDQRRGAFYLTGTVGYNVNNTNVEFGVGPSLSWRSIMFSVLYDWGHDLRLTQGEDVGMIWCNQSSANSSGTIPKCSGSPPSPSTEKYWKGAVAFGISVRIPTIFGGGGSAASSH